MCNVSTNRGQLDLEMSFSTGKDVMNLVEELVQNLYAHIRLNWRMREIDGQLGPTPVTARPDIASEGNAEHRIEQYPSLNTSSEEQGDSRVPFLRITYDEAMSLYGSDKPDLRIPNQVGCARRIGLNQTYSTTHRSTASTASFPPLSNL